MSAAVVLRTVGLASVAGGIMLSVLATHHARVLPSVDARSVVKAGLEGSSAPYVAHVKSFSRMPSGETTAAEAHVHHNGSQETIVFTGGDASGMWATADGDSTLTFVPEAQRLLVGSDRSELTASERTALLLDNYRAQLEGRRSVAGRDAYIVRLTPKHPGRPWKRLWIDAEKNIVLKSVDYSASGKERSRMEIASISFGPDEHDLAVTRAREAHTSRVHVSEAGDAVRIARKIGLDPIEPAYLPAGFVVEGSYVFHCPCNCGHRSIQTCYTDGLNTLSVFQTPADAECCEGSCHAGEHDCVVQGSDVVKVGNVKRSDRSIVVVADLPPGEVRRIIESMP